MKIDTLNINRALSVVFKRKAIILMIFAFTLILAAMISFLVTPKYKVFTELLLDLEEKKVQVTPISTKQISLDLTNRINSEKALFRSTVVLKALALKYPDLQKRLNRDGSTFRRKIKDSFSQLFSSGGKKEQPSDGIEVDERVRFLSEAIKVGHLTKSNILTVSLKAGNPVFGVQVINDLLGYYLKHRVAVGKFPEASNFFDEQIDRTKQRLDGFEEELNDFQQKETIIDYKTELLRLTKKVEFFDTALASNRAEIITLEEDLAEIKTNLKRGDLTSIPSAKLFTQPILSKIHQKRVDLQLNLVRLKQDYKDQDPQVLSAIKEIQMVDGVLRREVSSIVEMMKSSLVKLKSEEKALNLILEDLEKLSQSLPKAVRVINKLKRNIENEKITLANLVQKRNQEMISEARDNRVENVKLVTPPTYSRKKVQPKRGLLLFIGACLGLIVGLGLVLIQAYFDQSFNNEEELSQYIDLPVLGTIHDFTKN